MPIASNPDCVSWMTTHGDPSAVASYHAPTSRNVSLSGWRSPRRMTQTPLGPRRETCGTRAIAEQATVSSVVRLMDGRPMRISVPSTVKWRPSCLLRDHSMPASSCWRWPIASFSARYVCLPTECSIHALYSRASGRQFASSWAMALASVNVHVMTPLSRRSTSRSRPLRFSPSRGAQPDSCSERNGTTSPRRENLDAPGSSRIAASAARQSRSVSDQMSRASGNAMPEKFFSGVPT